MIADEKVFDLIPLKKEIKAEVSGLLYCRRKRNPRFPSDTGSQKRKVSLQKFKKDKNCQINAVRHIN